MLNNSGIIYSLIDSTDIYEMGSNIVSKNLSNILDDIYETGKIGIVKASGTVKISENSSSRIEGTAMILFPQSNTYIFQGEESLIKNIWGFTFVGDIKNIVFDTSNPEGEWRISNG